MTPAREIPAEVVQTQGLALVDASDPVQREIRLGLMGREHPKGAEPPVDWKLRYLVAFEAVPFNVLDACSLSNPTESLANGVLFEEMVPDVLQRYVDLLDDVRPGS